MLTWISVDLRTGRVLEEFPDLSRPTVSATIGAYTSTTVSLPLPTAPENWDRATLPGGAVLLLLDDAQDGTLPVPLWGGVVSRRETSSGDEVSLGLVTAEAHLDRRYVGDVTYTATGQNAIVADLISRFVSDTFPVRVVQLGGAGTLRTRKYKDASDKTVLSALQELSGVIGGPEWTIAWEHQSAPERWTPVLTVGARLGVSPIAGLAPAASFDLPGAVTEATLTEDYSAGKGATQVVASSSATADVRPQSPPQTSGDGQRPTIEYRFTPSTSIADVSTLTAHALAAVTQMASGARALSLSASVADAPRLGVDWSLGDDVGYDLVAPAWPNGLRGTARAWGWSMNLKEPITISPILVMED